VPQLAAAGVRVAVPHRVASRFPPRTSVVEVNQDGIELIVRGADRVVDVTFDGRRIWSFWVARDTIATRGFHRRVTWPERMERFLNGRSRVTVVDHVDDVTLYDGELTFGDGDGRVAFVNKAGLEISLDKSGRFSPTFSVRSDEHLAPLLDAMERLVEVLGRAGVAAFPAWGTLLGAVREQNLLGHDSDADLSYLSRSSVPVDVIRESFELQRLLNANGFETYRYSGAAFRIQVVEGDGTTRGLDLFAAFYGHGRLYVMGEVGADYREDWLTPLTTCRIADREFNAPARPDKMLEAMYGPSWRVPDPAFQFVTPPDVKARLNGWFRGLAPDQREWEAELARHRRLDRRPSGLARLLHEEEPGDATVLEVGIGRGSDSLWLARRRRTVVGYDFASKAGRAARRIATRRGLDLSIRHLNFSELRSVLGEGARVAHQDGPRVVLARHVLDAVSGQGRENVARFASMCLRTGGRLYADVWTGSGPGDFGIRPMTLDDVVSVIESSGGSVASAEVLPESNGEPRSPGSVCRVVAEWT
jgi:hypothetical protein